MSVYIANTIILSFAATLIIGLLIDIAVGKFDREWLHLMYAACIVAVANMIFASWKIYEYYQNLPVEIPM